MKIICIGRNYTDHIKELANEKPADPIIFMKPDSAVLGNGLDFYIPEYTNDVHHEVEVLVKISKVGKHINKKFAHKYYTEVGLGIDFTARDIQTNLREKGLPWEKAKGFDGSAVIGSWLPKSEFEDLNNINFHLKRNKKIVQKGNTSLMLWRIDELIAFISTFFTLKKGDVIFTGTPAGVSKVSSNDCLEGFIEDKRMFAINIK